MFKRVIRGIVLFGFAVTLCGIASLFSSCCSCNGSNCNSGGGCGLEWYETQYVSASSAPQNTPANGLSGAPSASTDARFIAFSSVASNLVSPATPGDQQVYLRDTCGGSTAPSGCQAKTILVSVNASGQAVANCFGSPSINFRPGISGDGRYVVFESNGCDLGFGTNEATIWQIYVRDTCTGPNGPGTLSGCTPNTVAITHSSLPSRHPTISQDGIYVAFQSNATDLPADGQGTPPAGTQIYVADLSICEGSSGIRTCNPHIVLVSQTASGAQASSGKIEAGNTNAPQVSPSGRFVVFTSNNQNIGGGTLGTSPMQLFVADSCMSAGSGIPGCTVQTLGPFSSANADVLSPSIDSSARFLAYASTISGTQQIFAVDDCTVPKAQPGCTPSTKLVSTTLSGTAGNLGSDSPFMAPNGGAVAFHSLATNFIQVGTVTNGDVFVSSNCFGNPSGCVTGAVGLDTFNCKLPNNAVIQPVFDVNSDQLAFASSATNLDSSVSAPGVFLAKTGQ